MTLLKKALVNDKLRFKYCDVKEAVKKFEECINYMYKDSINKTDEIILTSNIKEIFGDFGE